MQWCVQFNFFCKENKSLKIRKAYILKIITTCWEHWPHLCRKWSLLRFPSPRWRMGKHNPANHDNYKVIININKYFLELKCFWKAEFLLNMIFILQGIIYTGGWDLFPESVPETETRLGRGVRKLWIYRVDEVVWQGLRLQRSTRKSTKVNNNHARSTMKTDV